MNLTNLFYHIVTLSLAGSILAAGLLVIKRLFRRELSANWNYYIWFMLVIRLIIPFTPSIQFNAFNPIPAHSQVVTLPEIQVTNPNEADSAPVVQIDDSSASRPQETLPEIHNTQEPQTLQLMKWFNWHNLSLVWISGVAVILLYILSVNSLFLLKARKLAACDSEEILSILEECKFKLNINSNVPVVYDPHIESPAVFGLFHPKICVSHDIVKKLSPEDLSHIFMHELSHLKRGDLPVNGLMMVIHAIYWFNPMVWYALHRMKQDCEIACDANVLASLKPEEHRKYGQTLINLMQLLSQPHWSPGTLGFANKFNKRRIIMIKKMKKTKIKWAALALVLTLLVGCSSLSSPIRLAAPVLSKNEAAAKTSVSSDSNSVVYENTQYGFNLTLPESWKGYTIVNSEWQGISLVDKSGVVQTGPMISIRDPKWTSKTPRQDIPIMIFTLGQWNLMQNGVFHIGAAPINPSELGRNNSYVFALPARYNYAFPPGYEEVEKILEGKPLHTTQVSQPAADPSESLISDIMILAKLGKIINSDFSAKTNVIDNVQESWGKADKVDYVAAACGTYYTYTDKKVVFGVNKGDQIFEVRSFDSSLKGISLSMAKKVLGTPAHDVIGNREEIIGYTTGTDFNLEMVFPKPTDSNPDPVMDHYNVLYPAGTVNTMQGNPGRQW